MTSRSTRRRRPSDSTRWPTTSTGSTAPVTRSASIPPPTGANLADTLPPLDEFPITAQAPASADEVIEVWSSTEKSGQDSDGWYREVADDFNNAGITLSDGSVAGVDLRSIASGTGYQFIARGEELPQAYTPSNELWVQMASEFQPLTQVRPSTVTNVAGIVMKDETADELRAKYGELTPEILVEAVIAGDLVMGYTDPFASSTGLNFLLTVLDSIAEGDPGRLTSPDVASVFEQFQRQVPFVALTTLQMRDSVANDTGTLDAFVMEWQTYANTESLQNGYEFIPFGVRHDNPLYTVGDLTPVAVGGARSVRRVRRAAPVPAVRRRLRVRPAGVRTDRAGAVGIDADRRPERLEGQEGRRSSRRHGVRRRHERLDGGHPDPGGPERHAVGPRVHQAVHRGGRRRVQRRRHEAARHRRVRPQPTGTVRGDRRGPHARVAARRCTTASCWG